MRHTIDAFDTRGFGNITGERAPQAPTKLPMHRSRRSDSTPHHSITRHAATPSWVHTRTQSPPTTATPRPLLPCLHAAVYGVPVAPGRCRAIVRQPFRFKNKLLPLAFKVMPAFLGHLGNNSVLDEDNIFLHMQARACFLPAVCATDVCVRGVM